MKRICLALFLLLSCLVLIACNKAGHVAQKNETSARKGVTAPDFTLKNLEGRDVRLSQYRGKIVLLEFWAPWCPPCKAAIPELGAVQAKYRDRDVVVLGIAVDEDIGSVRNLSVFSQEHGIDYPVLLGNESVERSYHVGSIPMTFVIDREGVIVHSHMGYMDKFAARLSEEIERIL